MGTKAEDRDHELFNNISRAVVGVPADPAAIAVAVATVRALFAKKRTKPAKVAAKGRKRRTVKVR